MAVRLIKVGNSYNMPIHKYVCDQLKEMSDIITHLGDKVTVAEEGVTYVRNSLPHFEQEEAKWVIVSSGSGGGAALTGKEYSLEESYKEGDYVTKDGLLYVAQDTIAAGTDFAEALEDGKWKETPFILYADDVVDGYYNAVNGKFYSNAAMTQEITPIENSKIYVDKATGQTLHKGSNGLETIKAAQSEQKIYTGTIQKEKVNQSDEKYTFTFRLNEEIDKLKDMEGSWILVQPVGQNPLYEELQNEESQYNRPTSQVRIIDKNGTIYSYSSEMYIPSWGFGVNGANNGGLIFRCARVQESNSNLFTLVEAGRELASSSLIGTPSKKYDHPGIVFLTSDLTVSYPNYAFTPQGANAMKIELEESIEEVDSDLEEIKGKINTFLSADLNSDIIENRAAYYKTEQSYKLLDSDIEGATPVYTIIMEQEG